MALLQQTWDKLEGSIFQYRISRAASVFIILAVVQSAVFFSIVVSLIKISRLSQSTATIDQIQPTIRLSIGIGIVGILLVVVLCLLFWNMYKYLMTKPLSRVNSLFLHLASGSTDLSKDIEVLPNPELADVSKGYNAFMLKIRAIIENLRESGLRIAIDSTRMHRIVKETSAKTSQQTELSDQVAIFSSDANTAIKEVAENAQFVSQKTSSNLDKIKVSYKELEYAANKVQEINHTVATFRDTVEDLNRSATSIMEFVEVINNISDQTNLLSLNATIEAARAGEHGKGFAVVAEEVRTLAKRVKPATEDISTKIKAMVENVHKTMAESEEIIQSSAEINDTIHQTSEGFSGMIGGLEETDEQLIRIAAAIEELSLNNNEINGKVEQINALTHEVQSDMQTSSSTVAGLNNITEQMQEMVSQYKTGNGLLDEIIDQARQHRDVIQSALVEMFNEGIDIFDEKYVTIPNTDPPKYTTSFSAAFDQRFQAYFDDIRKKVPGGIYSLVVDRNGYLPTHHSEVSKPLTGDYETDLLSSREKRIYDNVVSEKRRASNTTPMLMQTYMRDTGEILNELSMPITVDRRHWGGFLLGLNPDIFKK